MNQELSNRRFHTEPSRVIIPPLYASPRGILVGLHDITGSFGAGGMRKPIVLWNEFIV